MPTNSKDYRLPSLTVLILMIAFGKKLCKLMNLNNSILPVFIIIADTFNRVVFVSQRIYNRFSEQLMKVVHGL